MRKARCYLPLRIHFPPLHFCTEIGQQPQLQVLWLLIGFRQERASAKKEERDARYLFRQLHPWDMASEQFSPSWFWDLIFSPPTPPPSHPPSPCPAPGISSLSMWLKDSNSSVAAGPGFLNAPWWFSHTPTVSLLLVCFFMNSLLNYSNLTVLCVSCWDPD